MRYPWLAFLLLCVVAPVNAAAGCYDGATPDWNDIRFIEIVRCQLTDPRFPCYHAAFFVQDGQIFGASLEANSFRGRRGNFVTQDPSSSVAQRPVRLLKEAQVFALSVPSRQHQIAILDAPVQEIRVRRCSMWVAIQPDGDIDENSQGWTKFMTLIHGLESVLDDLHWHRQTGASLSMLDIQRRAIH